MPEPAAAPMRPRQHDATRAEQRAGKKKTSARRSPAPPRQESGTTSGAQAPAGDGRRSNNYDAAEVLEKSRQAIADKFASVTFSISDIARELGYRDKNDRALAAVRHAVLELIGENVVTEAGKGRGGHPRYMRVDTTAHGAQEDAGVELVDRIVEALEVDGGRISRLDLKARVGDPDFEEFSSALDLLLAERKIARVQAGGLSGYELV